MHKSSVILFQLYTNEFIIQYVLLELLLSFQNNFFYAVQCAESCPECPCDIKRVHLSASHMPWNEIWALSVQSLDKLGKWATGTLLETVRQGKFRQGQEGPPHRSGGSQHLPASLCHSHTVSVSPPTLLPTLNFLESMLTSISELHSVSEWNRKAELKCTWHLLYCIKII